MFEKEKTTRLKRFFRKNRRKAEKGVESVDSSIDQHLANKVHRLQSVRRFVIGWIVIVLLVIGLSLYQFNIFFASTRQTIPAEGGVFREGVVGKFTNANPVFATGSADSSASRLLYSGLLKYDGDGKLQVDLAESFKVDETGTNYEITLKKDLKWQDKKPITTKDVEYTYRLIQNPDAKSPLRSSWQGVQIKIIDERKILFTIQGALSSFPQYLTNGIIPEHVFAKIDPAQVRSSSRNNQDVVGSGPFKMEEVEVQKFEKDQTREKLSLVANTSYHLGRPKIDQYILQTYRDEQSLKDDFSSKRLDAINAVAHPETVIEEDDSVVDMSRTLTSQVNVFFKMSEPQFADVNVRKALVLGIDRSITVNDLGYAVKISDSPFLDTTFAYNKALTQKTNNIAEAKKILDSAGWTVGAGGIRQKAGQKMEFSLSVRNLEDYKRTAESLKKQWHEIGVDVKLITLDEDEMQSSIASHNYTAILTAINLGQDPDIFPFWHSSQKDIGSSTRLNLSEYSSKQADLSLEAGRSRTDPSVRAIKYQPFLSAWISDVPALTIYQPRYVFLVREPFYNFNINSMSINTDRYSNVHNWTVKDKSIRK